MSHAPLDKSDGGLFLMVEFRSLPGPQFEDIKTHRITSHFHFPFSVPGDHFFKKLIWDLVSVEKRSFISQLIHKKKEKKTFNYH